MKKHTLIILVLLVTGLFSYNSAIGQYVDQFNQDKLDPEWRFFAGDGEDFAAVSRKKTVSLRDEINKFR